ncbi:GTP 3',8-cyclase MoaA [Sphingobacteriales bacterium UPWRP_1]|nr:GTP 3',8-cyclase MoaA [Sphingobacteriales bacterium TSM_CSM]PSJ72860.1 GTP 3',8-cyclase MoaA [Sphingobacteriales bacterium UPWRP_1]
MLTDGFNRPHNYLRISLTDHCNFRCTYCMPNENMDFMPAAHLMQQDEIDRIAGVFVQLGVNKIRLTGGEPLVRKDAAAIMEKLAKYNTKLTLTTNGVRVHEFLQVFKKTGITSINVSLDTLNSQKFTQITRRNEFDRVWNNIELLLDNGFKVKVNMVVMKGVNEFEIPDFVALTRNLPLHVRFIEFMPFTGNRWLGNRVFTYAQMLELIGGHYPFTPLEGNPNDTAKKFKIPGHSGTFAIISTVTEPFCATCNRMRLTADGKMKNCLFSAGETDILTALRAGADIVPLIQQCLSLKEADRGGQFTASFEQLDATAMKNRSMITIGG